MMNYNVEAQAEINPFLPRLFLGITFYHSNKNLGHMCVTLCRVALLVPMRVALSSLLLFFFYIDIATVKLHVVALVTSNQDIDLTIA